MNHLKALHDMANKWQVLSPDGFTIERYDHYKTRKDALQALERFCKRYITQGYYSSSNRGHISLEELPNACKLTKIK